ncbi:MAG: amidohydrolase family protein [archaeon GB-1867-005]|nr:amidohydrolase family protein [Candidatus Culexmicrobium cathedralense]
MARCCGKSLALVNGFLIDGSGSSPIDRSVVVVEGGRIRAVGRVGDVEVPAGAEVIDVDGLTVMPGLIDAHVHFMGTRTHRLEEYFVVPEQVRLLRCVSDAEALLGAGFTTVKDCGGTNGLYLKMAINEGSVRGPRILAAGHVLSQTFGHGDIHFLPIEWVKQKIPTICDGVDDCRRAARYALREGADFIKICATGGVLSMRDRPEHTQFSFDEIRAIVEEARKVGTFVSAHAQGTEGIKIAIAAGVKTIDHGIYLDDEAIRMMKGRNVILVPTLSISHQIVTKGKEAGIIEWGVRKAAEAFEYHLKSVKLAYEAGVKIATGTDFGGPPLWRMGTNAMELELLVDEVGFKPMDAIVSATKIAAEACGLADKIGTIEVGKLADVIVVDGNPLEDIRVLRKIENIRLVMKEGRIEVNRGV